VGRRIRAYEIMQFPSLYARVAKIGGNLRRGDGVSRHLTGLRGGAGRDRSGDSGYWEMCLPLNNTVQYLLNEHDRFMKAI